MKLKANNASTHEEEMDLDSEELVSALQQTTFMCRHWNLWFLWVLHESRAGYQFLNTVIFNVMVRHLCQDPYCGK